MATGTIRFQTALLFVAVFVQSSIGQDQRATPQTAPDAAAYAGRGLEYYQSGRFREAAEALNKAAQLKADDPAVYYNLGMSYMHLGRYMESAAPFRESLRLNPGLVQVYPKLGAVYNYFGQYREAADLLKEAARLGSGGVDVYNNLGVAYYHLGQYQEAAEALNRATILAPELAAPHRNLGNVYQMLGRYKEAGEARERADRITAAGGGSSGAQLLGINGPHPGAAPGQVTVGRHLGSSILIIKDDVRGEGGGVKTNDGEAVRSALPARRGGTGVSQQGEGGTPAQSIPVNLPMSAEVGAADKSTAAIPRVSNKSDASTAARTNAASATPGTRAELAPTPPASPEGEALTRVYRVGVGDVLDIRLLNSSVTGATLYPVLAGGLLDYPLAGEPVRVAGLTTDEVEARLASKIKIYDQPRVAVGVRDYNSHTVLVSGLVDSPGAKILRREAVPLYVVMADARPQAGAGQALIMSLDGRHRAVALDDAEAMSILVYPGDVLTVQGRQQQFFYVGGEVKQPGEKAFRTGITLTQAILIAGGRTRTAGDAVGVSRVGVGGLLVTSRYDIRKINSGKILDPVIQPGDRIIVRH